LEEFFEILNARGIKPEHVTIVVVRPEELLDD
jgi:hypothetical protein